MEARLSRAARPHHPVGSRPSGKSNSNSGRTRSNAGADEHEIEGRCGSGVECVVALTNQLAASPSTVQSRPPTVSTHATA